jgi:hypothetical protein
MGGKEKQPSTEVEIMSYINSNTKIELITKYEIILAITFCLPKNSKRSYIHPSPHRCIIHRFCYAINSMTKLE